MPSLVAEIGEVVERHLKLIGIISDDTLDEHQKKLIADKRAEYDAKNSKTATVETDNGDFPPDAQVCKKCSTKAAIVMDGCLTCLNCGDSKCG